MVLRKLILFLHFAGLLSFNIDVDQVIQKSYGSGALFGFSVSPHSISGENEYRFLVGAPLANASFEKESAQQPSGSVFSCPLTTKKSDCEELEYKIATSLIRNYDRSKQFFGMNVVSATPYGGSEVYACAPRLYLTQMRSVIYYSGMCHAFDNKLKWAAQFATNCQGSSKNVIVRFCLNGMSVATNEKNQVLIGSPFTSNSAKSLNSGASYLYNYLSWTSATRIHTLKTPRPAYIGWSVAMGRIFKESQLTVVSGGPGIPMKGISESSFIKMNSSQIGMGMVLLHKSKNGNTDFTDAQAIIGTQFASRFGHSLLVVDVNNDTYDDLLVGAPDYRSNKDTVGSGAVYLYMNDKGNQLVFKHKFQPPPMTIEECGSRHCERSQFGFALSNLKDVNVDGYNDVGISAPGEGEGVIYIYHGTSTGLGSTPVQKISLPKTKSFGYSLGHGMDLDSNGYPDLVVGAMGSNSAAVMRARPILRVEVEIIFEPPTLNTDLEANRWSSCMENKAYCFYMTVKYNYREASKRDRFNALVPGNITVKADTAPTVPGARARVKFVDKDGKLTDKVMRDVTFTPTAKDLKIQLAMEKDHFIDKMSGIRFNVTWTLGVSNPPPLNPDDVLPTINNFPVYDQVNNFKTKTLNWTNACGGKVCTSDLRLSLNTSLEKISDPADMADYVYFMGKDNMIWMNFSVKNYEGLAQFVQLVLERNDKIALDSYNCAFGCREEEDKIICGVSNPLGAERVAQCNVRLSTSNLRPDMRYLNFSASVTTLSKNLDRHQVSMKFRASVKIQANIQLTSTMSQYQLTYKSTKVIGASAIKHEKKIGDERITVSFKLENRLRSLVPSSTLTIFWPYEIAGNPREPHGKYLLYLLKSPDVESRAKDNVVCDPAALKRITNPIGVRLLNFAGGVTNYTGSGRYRREVSLSPSPLSPPPKENDYVICSNGLARCIPVKCKIGELGKKTGPITIKFVFRVWIHTLVEDFENQRYVEVAVAAQWASDPRYSVTQVGGGVTRTNATLMASNDMTLKPKPPKEFTLIIVISILVGVVLLGCLIIILWKCNFFKRTNLEAKQQELLRQSRFG